jgi:hypothetical protein
MEKLNACVVTVTIPDGNPGDSKTWRYHGPYINNGVLSVPKNTEWIVFVLDEKSAKTFTFLAPEGVPESDNWVVQSWSDKAVVVRDTQETLKISGTFILWVRAVFIPGEFYSGGPEVINTGDPAMIIPPSE